MSWKQKNIAYQHRKALQKKAVEYLGNKCILCGYDKCLSALDFHHPDPQGKIFSISKAMTSWKRILPELNKCILLCANCHREVHEGLHPGFLILDGVWAPPIDDEE